MKINQEISSLNSYLNMMPYEDAFAVKALAHHEAGHAVFVWRRGFCFGKFGVTLNPHDRVGLCTQSWMREQTKFEYLYDNLPNAPLQYFQADIDFLLAGAAAENIFLKMNSRPQHAFQNHWADYDYAKYIVEKYGDHRKDPEKKLFKDYRRVARIMNHPRTWAAVEAVGDALLKYNYLNGEHALEIIGQFSPPKNRYSEMNFFN